MTTAKQRAEEVRREINAKLGKDVLRKASDPEFVVEYLPTGLLPIDVLLNGGIPMGRFVELYGDYSTLKSYIGYHAIATTQKAGHLCGLIDTEHSFDPAWAKDIGVDVDALIIERPQTGEEAVDAMQVMAATNNLALIVWDSVAATLPQDEASKRMDGEQMQPARLAALMSAGLRKINATNKKTAILCINQTRLSIGVTFGNPESIPGGKALPFYASYRVSLRKAGLITRDVPGGWERTATGGLKRVVKKVAVAQKIRATMVKSKLSKPHSDTMLLWDMERDRLDVEDYLIIAGLEAGMVKNNGSGTWELGSTKVRGNDKFRDHVREHPELLAPIEAMVRARAGLPGTPAQGKKRVAVRKRKS